MVDHDQSSTHDNHYALLFGYSGREGRANTARGGAHFDVADYGKPCRVDMGNVGLMFRLRAVRMVSIVVLRCTSREGVSRYGVWASRQQKKNLLI